MKTLLIIIAFLLSTACYSQQFKAGDTLIVENDEKWQCGPGQNPRIATVEMIKGKPYIRFDFIDVLDKFPVLWDKEKALAYWRREGTVIVNIKK